MTGISTGLSLDEVRVLKQKFGDNLLPAKEKNSWYRILFSQFTNPLVILLLVVGLLSLNFGESLDALLIGLVIMLDIVIGFVQEFSAQRTLTALRKIIKQKSFVVREGKRMEVETKDLVPDDLVVISSGDRVPADGIIIQCSSMLVDEAILTGESEAVIKNCEEGKNGIYMGSTIVAGQGIMRVEKIGTQTKMGKIGQSLSEIEEAPTPLQKRLNHLSKTLIIAVVVICLIIFTAGVFEGGNYWETLKISIVLSLAAIPEGLPIAVTAILAVGMRRVLKKKGLIKKLLSIETLGSTSVVCLDKTGTITEGKMQVVKTDFKNAERFLLALTLLNDRKLALEASIWDYLKRESKVDPDTVFNNIERVSDEPFDSAKKYKGVINNIHGKEVAFLMGAPDIVINFCAMTPNQRTELLGRFEEWAMLGLRLIGVASKEKGDLYKKTGFNWLGLVGIEDPVRKEAAMALREARDAGIQIKIVTGDFRLTAEQVAKKIGMNLAPENILDFEELESISDHELAGKIDKVWLFSRVTPLQKLRIVKILQSKGEIVAMTGDGVNDAPALKKADIGIVVENGTDVAKESADLILLDSNFKTIVNACEEGRLVLANIKKVIGYVLSNSFAEITLIFGAELLRLPIPLTVAQILWIHLICDGPLDIMLGFEPKEKDIMRQNPKELAREQIFSTKLKSIVVIVSLAAGLSCLAIYKYYLDAQADMVLARTIIFAILAVISIVYIFSFKNLNKLLIQTENLWENKYLLLSVVYSFILVFMAIYLPGLNRILGTVPLSLNHWVLIAAVSVGITLIVELAKVIPVYLKNWPFKPPTKYRHHFALEQS